MKSSDSIVDEVRAAPAAQHGDGADGAGAIACAPRLSASLLTAETMRTCKSDATSDQ